VTLLINCNFLYFSISKLKSIDFHKRTWEGSFRTVDTYKKLFIK